MRAENSTPFLYSNAFLFSLEQNSTLPVKSMWFDPVYFFDWSLFGPLSIMLSSLFFLSLEYSRLALIKKKLTFLFAWCPWQSYCFRISHLLSARMLSMRQDPPCTKVVPLLTIPSTLCCNTYCSLKLLHSFFLSLAWLLFTFHVCKPYMVL